MPRPDPIPSPRGSLRKRFWRLFRLLVLFSAVVAALAVFLVTRGEGAIHLSLIIATGLGVAFTVLLGTSLMTLLFLSAESGHDEAAALHVHDESEDE